MAEKSKSKPKSKSSKYTRGGITFSGYNEPKRTPGARRSHAVLAKEGDKVRLVRFGDPDMPIKKDQKKNKASYCARSGGIKGKDSKLSANYWSRRAWDC